MNCDFIVVGIKAGKLEYREGIMWGKLYLRLLSSRLEQFITDDLGADHFTYGKKQTEFRKLKRKMVKLKNIEGTSSSKSRAG